MDDHLHGNEKTNHKEAGDWPFGCDYQTQQNGNDAAQKGPHPFP